MTGPRDWDKEMAEIDKLIAADKPSAADRGTPAVRRDAPVRAADPAQPPVVTHRKHTLGVWLRALLGTAGAVALPFWPYGRSCGTFLWLYLVGALGVSAAGVWTMRGAWVHRRGVAHVAGLLILFAGLALAGIEILQRTGFVAVRRAWFCP